MVAFAGGAQVVDEARCVSQILRFAIAQRQTGKNTSHLQMPLQPHPFHATVELAKIIAHRKARLARLFPVPYRDVEAEIFFPAKESVPHQAGYVISDRAIDCILKIQHTKAA